jgi:hypothetical protein
MACAPKGTQLNRRHFFLSGSQALAMAALAAPARARAGAVPSARDIVSSLQGLADAELIAGRPDARGQGTAVLADPTLAALRAAVAAGASLVLSPETPFYARLPDPAAANGPAAAMGGSALAALENSPAYQAKRVFIAEHGLTVYRLVPRTGGHDVSAEAMAARLGWTAHRLPGEHPIYAPPGLTLAGLVQLAHARLGAAGGLRFIGDPAMALRSVLVVPGTAEAVSTTRALRHAHALLTGDVREWEVVTYVHDSIEAGQPKALVATGRILSEQPFVERCALAVQHAFPLLPLHHPAQPDPFWRVQA